MPDQPLNPTESIIADAPEEHQRVLMPDGSIIRFPRTMSDADIHSEILKMQQGEGPGSRVANISSEFFKHAVPFTGDAAGAPGHAASYAAIQHLFGAVPPGETYPETYHKNLADREKSMAQFEKEHPVESGALNIAGATAGLGATTAIPKVGTAVLRGMGATDEGVPFLQSAAFGAGQSAAEAAFNKQDPGTAAIVGAALGAPIPLASRMAAAKGGEAWDKISSLFSRATGTTPQGASPILKGVDPRALKWGHYATEADALTDQSIANRAKELGPQGMTMEHGRNLGGQAEYIYQNPGAGQRIIGEALDDRARQLPTTIESALDQHIGPRLVNHNGKDMTLAEYTRALETERNNTASPLYQRFHATPVHPTQALKDLLPRLEAAGVVPLAKKAAGVEGIPYEQNFFTTGPQKSFPTTASWDNMKQALDDQILRSYETKGTRAQATSDTRRLTQLKQELIDAIDNHPDPRVANTWRAARQAWATPTEMENALRAGQDWRSEPYDEIPYTLSKLSGPAKLAYKQGVRRDYADIVDDSLSFNRIPGGSLKGGTRIVNELINQGNQKRLESIIGKQGANDLLTEAERADVFTNTRNRSIGNSRTATREFTKDQMEPKPEDLAINRFRELYSPHVTPFRYMIPRAMQHAAEAKQITEYEASRNSLAPLMTKQGPDAEAFVKALKDYRPPSQVAPEIINYYTNLLAHGAIPSSASGVQSGVSPYIEPFSVLTK